MQRFLSKYPMTGEALILLLLGIIGWFIIDMRDTYVKTSERMIIAFEHIAEEVKSNTIKNAEQDVRISVCEKGS